MKNLFRMRAKHEVFGRTDTWYIVKCRKWWQLRWHTLTSGSVYPWMTADEHEAKEIVEKINNGKLKL